MLVAMGEDAVVAAFFARLSLRDKRSLACTSDTLRGIVTLQWRSAQLTVAETDADWNNATFVAGLRSLETLRVGDSFFKLMAMRTQSFIDIAGIGAASALFLGASFGGDVRVLILADGREVDAAQLRTCRTLNLDSLLGQGPAPIAEADIAMLLGIIWRNPRLDPNAAMELLGSRAFVNSEEYRFSDLFPVTEEDAERRYMEWARAWKDWARARGAGQSSGR